MFIPGKAGPGYKRVAEHEHRESETAYYFAGCVFPPGGSGGIRPVVQDERVKSENPVRGAMRVHVSSSLFC